MRWLVAMMVMVAAARVEAHPLDLGYLRVDGDGEMVTLTLDVEARLSPTLRDGAIATDRGACTWVGEPATAVAGTTRTLVDRARCPAGSHALHLALPFVRGAYQVLAKTHGFAGEHVAIIDARTAALDARGASTVGLGSIVWTGVRHIGAAPSEWHDPDRGFHLPDGIDHICFLLALLLAGGTVWQLAKIATGFTIGHSITLALAASGILQPPAQVIEPLVALTIALAGLEAFTGFLGAKHRAKIALAFGLVHGFAFASALAELDLSTTGLAKPLFGFNFGVELGQLALICAIAPAILLLHRYRPRAAAIVTKAAALAIAVAGLYWFVTRL